MGKLVILLSRDLKSFSYTKVTLSAAAFSDKKSGN